MKCSVIHLFPEMTPTFHQLNDSLNSSDVLTQSQLSANEAGTPSSGADCTLKIPKDGNRNSAALKKKKKKRGIWEAVDQHGCMNYGCMNLPTSMFVKLPSGQPLEPRVQQILKSTVGWDKTFFRIHGSQTPKLKCLQLELTPTLAVKWGRANPQEMPKF